MALIPLQSIPEAVKELQRAVKELGIVGAVLPAVGMRQPLVIQNTFRFMRRRKSSARCWPFMPLRHKGLAWTTLTG